MSLFISFVSSAQDTNEKKSLHEILETLEVQYHIQFNYASETIENVNLLPPSAQLPINDALSYLEIQTGLIFNILNNDFVSIIKKSEIHICGYLKTRDDQLPIASAIVSTSSQTTTSDDSGFFQISIASDAKTIKIEHSGFATLIIATEKFKSEFCNTYYMNPKFQTLSEVVISNYIVNGINKLNDGTFEIDFSNFEILPGLVETDVLQAIQAFPGIQSANETVSNISIRGGSHDQNLILWDGIKMYQSGHFFGLISMYHPQMTQEVSLIKNGTDVSYSDGTSGTISMKTETDVNPTFKGSLGINFIDANGFVDVPLGKQSSLQVSARKSISEFVETPTYHEYFERISQHTEVETNNNQSFNSDKNFSFNDVSFRWIYHITPKDEIRLNFINVFNELAFDENAVIATEEKSRESKLSQNSIAEGLHYIRKWSNNLQTTLSAYETDYRLKASNANLMDSQLFSQKNSVSETSLKLNTSYFFDNGLQWLNGYEFVETEVSNLDDVDNPLYHSLVSEVLRSHSAYSQLTYNTKDKHTHLNAGLRFNYIEKFKKQLWEPRLSFNHRFLEHFTMEILGEFKHQTTSQVVNFQNDFLGIEKRRWQLSNDQNIPVITSRQVSLGLSYKNKGWLLSTEGYYKKLEGITSQSQGFQNQFEFIKTQGSYEVKGIDLLLRKQFGRFNSWLSYAFMKNNYLFKAISETWFPSNYDITHAVTLGLSYTNNHLKMATGFNWQSSKPMTSPVFGNEILNGTINYNAPNSDRMDDYMRVDMSAMYDWNITKSHMAKIGVSVWNVLNRKNLLNTTYRLDGDHVLKTEQNSLGITPNLILRVYL